MNCPKCGTLNSDTARFCSFCGVQLTAPDVGTPSRRIGPRQAPPPRRGLNRKARIVANAALVIVASLVIAGVAMNWHSNSGSNSAILNKVPNLSSSNNSTSPPQIKASADINPSGSGDSVTDANMSNQTALAQTSNSSSNQTPESQSDQTPNPETTPASNATTSDNTPSENQTSPAITPIRAPLLSGLSG